MRKRRRCPAFVEPMLASLVEVAALRRRAGCTKSSSTAIVSRPITRAAVTLLTRTGLDWTEKFGDAVVEAFKALAVREALIDGELVVENAAGASNFSSLQADLSEGRTDRFLFYAFDLIYLDGYDLREVAADRPAGGAGARRSSAKARVALRLSDHFDEDGADRAQARLPARPRRHRLEAARLALRSGRGKGWTKAKCSDAPGVRGGGLRSLDRRGRRYRLARSRRLRGRRLAPCRPGRHRLQRATARAPFTRRLEPMRVTSSPFADRLNAEEARQVRFVRPELVAEVDFRAWTADGLLRHAAFVALREDKPAARGGPRDRAGPSAQAPSRKAPKPQLRSARSPIPIALYWPDEGVTKDRASPTITPKSGRSWRRSSSGGRSRYCAARRDHRATVLPEARLERAEQQHRPRRGSPKRRANRSSASATSTA